MNTPAHVTIIIKGAIVYSLENGHCTINFAFSFQNVIYKCTKCTTRSVVALFFFNSWEWVRWSPFGMSDTNGCIVPTLDDRWVCSSQWNDTWQGKLKYCSIVTLSTTDLTWHDLGLNSGCYITKPATDHLSYGTALLYHNRCFPVKYNGRFKTIAYVCNVTNFLHVFQLWHL
jgi:hypothetical protein